jgi:hypothetical protein
MKISRVKTEKWHNYQEAEVQRFNQQISSIDTEVRPNVTLNDVLDEFNLFKNSLKNTAK